MKTLLDFILIALALAALGMVVGGCMAVAHWVFLDKNGVSDAIADFKKWASDGVRDLRKWYNKPDTGEMNARNRYYPPQDAEDDHVDRSFLG